MINLNSLDTGKRVRIQKIMPLGCLEARKNKAGQIMFSWRGSVGHQTQRVNIGFYDSRRPPKSLEAGTQGYSIAAAIKKAETIATIHQANLVIGGYREIEKQKMVAQKMAHHDAIQRSQGTLTHLLNAYVAYLQEQERPSWRDAQSIFKNHVLNKFPALANQSANQIEPEDVAMMMREVFQAGKGRTGNKLRAYLRAAFELAKQAKINPALPAVFLAFHIRHNPAADTLPDQKQNRSAKHLLSKLDLLRYWQSIQEDNPKCALLRFHFLTGGQRISQLLRLKKADIHDEYCIIYDCKGRPSQGIRKHIVPLPLHCLKDLQAALNRNRDCALAFSTDDVCPITANTLSNWAKACVGDAIVDFQLKRVRSGMETLLASMGISQEIRGHLQSHGITGIQSRHYNDYDYLTEKMVALSKIWAFVQEQG